MGIGLMTEFGIQSNAKSAERFLRVRLIRIMALGVLEKANKYTFWSFHPRFWHKNIPFGILPHVETLVVLSKKSVGRARARRERIG